MNKKLLTILSLLVMASMILAACAPAATEAPPPPTEVMTEAPVATEVMTEEPVMTEAPTEVVTEEPAAFECTDALGCVDVAPGDPVHVAFWGVLSGADATLGQDSQYGVEIAIDDRGGTLLEHDIQLTTEDGLCTPEGGSTAATKLAVDTTIVALVGSSCSDETVGGIATLTNAGLTTISPSNTRPVLTAPDRGPDYAGYLRTAHSDAFQGKTVAEFAWNVLKVTKAATIHDGSSYAQALQQVFVDNFTALGGEVVAQEAVAKTDTDMHAVLTTVAAAGPELLYYPIFIAAGGYISAQAKEVTGLENTILMGSDGMFSPDFITAGGAATKDMYLSSPDFSLFPAGYNTFVDKYKEKYGTAPLSIFHAHAYDAANIIFAAIEKVAVVDADGTIHIGRQALRDAIYATKDFQGITGSLTCSELGDCGAPVIAVYQIVDSDPTTWNPGVNPLKVYP
ncbi:MAG TPA: branched-chain amino acid ABC transporter substrate-binding protein [Anaerolineales bacterium]|nr:branched-chain amino acid ABC transporter substrate-binding protein [Anaerolineales bacterium]